MLTSHFEQACEEVLVLTSHFELLEGANSIALTE